MMMTYEKDIESITTEASTAANSKTNFCQKRVLLYMQVCLLLLEPPTTTTSTTTSFAGWCLIDSGTANVRSPDSLDFGLREAGMYLIRYTGGCFDVGLGRYVGGRWKIYSGDELLTMWDLGQLSAPFPFQYPWGGINDCKSYLGGYSEERKQYEFYHDGEGAIRMSVFDNPYSDNSGSLSFELLRHCSEMNN
eukprot:scaffold199_cov107-Amphora_coffeaeformis.AAC.1